MIKVKFSASSSSSSLHIFRQTYRSLGYGDGANFNTTDFNIEARSAFSYFSYHSGTYGECDICGTIRRLPRSKTPYCSIKKFSLRHFGNSAQVCNTRGRRITPPKVFLTLTKIRLTNDIVFITIFGL